MAAETETILPPGSTIGIVGGGQLARMLAIAASQYGLKVHIYAPEANSPAFEVSAAHTCASYEDEEKLRQFAAAVDVITYEFENIPAAAVSLLSNMKPLHPNAEALSTTQDRLSEKTFISSLGIETAPFIAVPDSGALDDAITQIGLPAVLKTTRFGYDGKGQIIIRTEADIPAARKLADSAVCILEGFVPFREEVSVIATRNLSGAFSSFDLCVNEHKNHILDITRLPANVKAETEIQAISIAQRLANALDYVGTLAVEMFLVEDKGKEKLVVNEIAPRVHNSGHWTIEGAVTSQFAQHIRAICNWPLGQTQRTGRIKMRNLIGHDINDWLEIVTDEQAHLHLYGKEEAREGRKMGHVTWVFPDKMAQ
ncbi:5-(carboxyamino)imidazole ribonucleotide synthase [Microvirga sp. W0021]|uniref:N5-carboxyaminoimidazole ribonucleotide synthase n=1 Tax=Hohaiivirga grylli TaxID=3133970 RepID=A0ABV0BLN0_9HYPH